MTKSDSGPSNGSKFTFASCAELKQKGLSEDQLLAELDKGYPAELVDPDRVEEADLSEADLKQLTSFAACIAAMTPGPDAPESALALFTSKKYGKQAFSVIEQLAKNPDLEGDNARAFATRMRDFANGPGE